ncbi:hypothetical protein VNO78_05208 [Psophocarpus tetragonolobus]|uniref:DNA repair protein XRCC2 homolog n=1 Tax=Psophocarpus tetragonolobus TaxID=3891 RepID=A0AAN9SQT7_PSOTE
MNGKEREEIEKWIGGEESGREMLRRVRSGEGGFRYPPPLDRVPLRAGNVVEIVGPSPSAKTHILIHAAITSLLPKHYGGLDHSVLFLDLDSRFDITRFSQLLFHRISQQHSFDHSLFRLCMARFFYLPCYDPFQFLHTLRTLHSRLEKQKQLHGLAFHLLLIDNIGAFHWMDRASASMFFSQTQNTKKKLFLQTVSEAVVHNIRKLLQVHPMLIIVTKSVIFGNSYSTPSNDVNGNMEEKCSKNVTRSHQNFQYREYMPSVWQSLVTHRILLHSSDDHVTTNHQNSSFYLLEWLLPRLSFLDKIVVRDGGVFVDS